MTCLTPRLPGFAVIAAIVIAAVLLVAGYGVPVGVGLIVGVLLGFVAAFGLVIWLRGQPRSSVGGSWHTTRDGSGQMSTTPPGFEVVQEAGVAMARVAAVDDSPITRVVIGNQVADASGIRVALTAIELRADGAVALLTARARPPAGPVGHFAVVSAGDDAGTKYSAAAQSESTGAATARITFRLAPAPPADATVLTLEIDRFLDPFQSAGSVSGPWTLVIPLRM
jgi:hypothetical protein